MLVRTPACIKTISGFSYLQRGTRIHCVPPQAIQYILFSLVRGYSRSLPIHPLIPGDGLQQQLPSQPHIASSLIGKKKKKNSHRQMLWKPAPLPGAKLRRRASQHICSFSPSSKNNQLTNKCVCARPRVCVCALLCISRLVFRVLLHGKGVFLLVSPRCCRVTCQ